MLPEIYRTRKAQTQIDVFRGLNRSVNTGFSRVSSNTSAVFSEFKDMQNMSGDDFPRLATRKNRSRICTEENKIISNIIISNGKLIYVTDNKRLKYGNEEAHIFNFIEGEHVLVSYGNNIIVLPEKKIFTLDELSSYRWQELTNIEISHEFIGLSSSNVYVPKSDPEIYSSFSIEKVDLDEYGKPRKARFKISASDDFTDISNQTKIGSSEGYKYQDVYKNIKIGETVETLTTSPSVLYRCASKEQKEGYNEDGFVRKFVRINSYYVRISTARDSETKLFSQFKTGDYVKISGVTIEPPSIRNEDTGQQLLEDLDFGNYPDAFNGKTFKVYYSDDNSIVIKTEIECSIPYSGKMKIERIMPEFDSDKILEVNNRLWTCSSKNNEIYACKQGDCENWYAYGDGISTDSFAMTVGCEGDFTAVARQNDSIIFFKENWVLKIFGTKPSNFTLAAYNVPGVEKGSSKSVVWVNGVLFYLSPVGVCQYSPGGQPVVISRDVFGNVKYKNGVAGRHKNKYFISAENESGEHELFVFDTDTGLWFKEDDTKMQSTVTYNNTLYYIDADTGYIMCADEKHNLIEDSAEFEKEDNFDWLCETGDLYDSDFNTKYISKIVLDLTLEEHAKAKLLAQFEDNGKWYELRTLYFEKKQPRRIPVAVRRADYLRLRLEGKGKCSLSGILIEYAQGSDRR